MITGIEIPLEAAIAASIAAFALGVLARRWPVARAARRRTGSDDPLAGLSARDRLASAIINASRQSPRSGAQQAVLHARIDQMAALRTGWDGPQREAILAQVAAVMKAGVRRDDRVDTIAGDGFTIIMPGADEKAARGVAKRLGRAVAGMKFSPLAARGLFTASFGVSAGAGAVHHDILVKQARAALRAAQAAGTDHVVAASEIEEVLLLPAPASCPAPVA